MNRPPSHLLLVVNLKPHDCRLPAARFARAFAMAEFRSMTPSPSLLLSLPFRGDGAAAAAPVPSVAPRVGIPFQATTQARAHRQTAAASSGQTPVLFCHNTSYCSVDRQQIHPNMNTTVPKVSSMDTTFASHEHLTSSPTTAVAAKTYAFGDKHHAVRGTHATKPSVPKASK